MELLITRPEREVLSYMKKAYYLLRSEDGEGLSLNGRTVSLPVKAGTIEALMNLGLIKESINGVKWLLTDEGRKYL